MRPGFRWDAADAYLFDIDGTLILSRDRVHYRSFFTAVEQVLGRSLTLDGVSLHGNTDPGILRDALCLAQVEDLAWRAHAPAVFAHMAATVARERAQMEPVVLPGVPEVLAHLQARGAALGIATGNIEAIGWIKMEQAGLRHWFRFGGFADGHEARAGMIGHALQLARAATHADASVVVIGDTVHDVAAARAHGLPVIAVATGKTSFDELMETAPDACVGTLLALLTDSDQGTA